MERGPIHTRLRTGAPILLRPLRSDDRGALTDAIEAMSDTSRYFRFFAGMKVVPEGVLDKLTNVDGDRHIAWCAIDTSTPGQPIIGAAHAIRTDQPGTADFALGVADAFHGQGVSRLLIAALVLDVCAHGIATFTASVMLDNNKARGLFKALGSVVDSRDGPIVQLRFDTATMAARLRAMDEPSALRDVFDAIADKPALVRRA